MCRTDEQFLLLLLFSAAIARAILGAMLKAEVLNYFGGVVETARQLGLRQPSVTNWEDPLPILRQLQIEAVTKGALRAGPECDPYRVPKHARSGVAA